MIIWPSPSIRVSLCCVSTISCGATRRPTHPRSNRSCSAPTASPFPKELRRGPETIRLTDREQEIMLLFALRAGDTIPRHELVEAESEVGERTIDVQINRLRRKIEDDPANPVYLQTVRGIGYRLSVD